MASSTTAKILLAVAIAVLVVAPAVDALSCGTVSGKLAPCINYVRGMGPLGVPCCDGIRGLNSLATTTKDRQDACKCLKEAANTIKNINLGLVAGLPSKCNVNIPYKLDPATDCSKVK